jgi:PAS domain S-box-containing protein
MKHATRNAIESFVLHDHAVQFYEDEAFMTDAVAKYIAPGVRNGHPVIVIATPPHRQAFAERLSEEGLDVDRATSHGVLTLLDARETLATFMNGDSPDPLRFRNTVGGLIQKTHAGREHLPLRAFGEMVDLLWRDGNPEGAISLESLWNELAMTHSFSLVCAYAMSNFAKEEYAERFRRVCSEHRQVFPTERYTDSDDRIARLREISMLQQKAQALETEIAQRKQLERVLRDSLMARQEAEAKLRQSEQDLKDFFENAVEGLHWVGSDGVILWANQAELDLLGYSREEYVGRNIAEFQADPDTVNDLFARFERNEAVHNYEARLRRKDGTLCSVLINSNVLWRNGEFVHTRCFTRDITDRKIAEVERDRLLVSECEARKEAEAANELKDQFLATVSHELRTPLTAILGWTELAKPDAREPAVMRAFEVIERNAKLQLQLVDDLLNVSRMVAGKLSINQEPVDIATVVSLVVESVRPKAMAKNLELRTAIDRTVGTVEGDAGRLQQVVGNLLTNALKFTPANGTIEVQLERQGNHACISVIDSGDGISADFLPHVFDRFRQAQGNLVRKHDGLGLGLAIVRYLVEAHNGRVEAHSEGAGRGARFVVLLPLSAAV